MKKLFQKFLFAACFVSVWAAGLAAQSPPAPEPATKVVGKAIIYESKTRTKVESVFLNRDTVHIMRVTYELPPGQAGAKPKGFQLFFQSVSDKGYKYKDDRKVAIILDKKRRARGEATIVRASCVRKDERECFETLLSPMLPFEDLGAMLKAKDVKIQFGQTVLKLTPEEKDGLRDLERIFDE